MAADLTGAIYSHRGREGDERKHRWGVWEHFVICTSKDFISVLFWCRLMISKLSSWVHSALTSLSKAHNPPQSLCARYNSNYCKHGYTFIHTFENNHIKSVECDRKRNTHTRWNQHIFFDTICLTLCLAPSMVSFNYTMQILMDAYTHASLYYSQWRGTGMIGQWSWDVTAPAEKPHWHHKGKVCIQISKHCRCLSTAQN